MPSSSATQSTMSFSGTQSGKSTGSNGSYVYLEKSGNVNAGAGAGPRKTGHKTSSTGHHNAHSVSAIGGGHSGTGATTYGSAGAGAVTTGSVSSSSSSAVSGKGSANSDLEEFPTDASDEEMKRNGKTTKAKKHGSKKHLSIDNVYTMGGKDGYGRAQVGSGSGAPTGCFLM